nr:site-specific integrase [Flaviflexus ciconiae]
MWLADELSPDHEGARKKTFQLFRAILSHAVDNELIGRNPCIRAHAKTVNTVRVSRRHAPRRVTSDELTAVLEVIAPSTRLIVRVLAHTGIRVGELRELRWSDIDLDLGLIRIRRGVTGDGGTLSKESEPKTPAGVRTVYIRNGLLDDLRAHVQTAPMTGVNGLVFPSPADPRKHFRENTIRRNIKRACEKAGVQHFSPHDLRNTFATLAGRAPGVSVRDVQAALGHTTPSMALRYMKSDEEQQTKVAEGVASQLTAVNQPGTVASLDARRASTQ